MGIQTLLWQHTVKKVSDFPVPNWDVINQTLPGQKELNYYSGQGEFDKRHPGWGRENC
jgi:hypothetical protein